jgi:AcrR family transcriptional regulator
VSTLSTSTTGPSDKQRQLLDAAARVVAEEGVRALSIRRLAAAVGTSTMAVYTWYGSKPNLMRAVYREAFSRFNDALHAALGDDDPLVELVRLGRAYRTYALAHPNFYEVMFGHSLASFQPQPPEDAELALATFDLLAASVGRAVADGLLAGDPHQVAWQIWAAVHGAVSLELAACRDSAAPGDDAEDDYARLGRTVLIGLGAPPARVDAALAAVAADGQARS